MATTLITLEQKFFKSLRFVFKTLTEKFGRVKNLITFDGPQKDETPAAIHLIIQR